MGRMLPTLPRACDCDASHGAVETRWVRSTRKSRAPEARETAGGMLCCAKRPAPAIGQVDVLSTGRGTPPRPNGAPAPPGASSQAAATRNSAPTANVASWRWSSHQVAQPRQAATARALCRVNLSRSTRVALNVIRKSHNRLSAHPTARTTEATSNAVPRPSAHWELGDFMETANPRDAVVRTSTVLLTAPSWVISRPCHRTRTERCCRPWPDKCIAVRRHARPQSGSPSLIHPLEWRRARSRPAVRLTRASPAARRAGSSWRPALELDAVAAVSGHGFTSECSHRLSILASRTVHLLDRARALEYNSSMKLGRSVLTSSNVS